MQTDRWVDQLIEAVRRRLEPQELTLAEEASEVSAGYLRKALGGTRNIMLAKYLRICENSGLDPAEIFAEVFPIHEEPLDFGVPIPSCPSPPIVRQIRRRIRQGGEVAIPLPRPWLEWLDTLRYDKPLKALELTESTIDFIPLEDAPLALGVWGSSCRLLSRYEDGFLACLEGLKLSRQQKNWLHEVSLLRRISFMVMSMAANYSGALEISERASLLCLRRNALDLLGQVLVDQGAFLGYLERYQEAEGMFRSALAG